jgi:hypothetical protein
LDKGVLQQAHIKDYESLPTEFERVGRMLELLQRRNDALFPAFCEALVETDQQYIVDLMTENSSSKLQHQQHCGADVISSAPLPPQIQINVNNPPPGLYCHHPLSPQHKQAITGILLS